MQDQISFAHDSAVRQERRPDCRLQRDTKEAFFVVSELLNALPVAEQGVDAANGPSEIQICHGATLLSRSSISHLTIG